jgi:hypothetical protein
MNINFNEVSVGQLSSPGTAFTVENDQANTAPNFGGEAIRGISKGEHGAVVGVNEAGPAMYGINTKNRNAIVGMVVQDPTVPVPNVPEHQAGVLGFSTLGEGVHGETSSNDHGAIVGVSDTTAPSWGGAAAIYGKGINAGYFEGIVNVVGDIRLSGGDCAEEFDLSTTDVIDAGTVMVLNHSGNLEQSNQAYDKKVAGIVSGAGSYKPAMVLDKRTDNNTKRVPIALMGKVYCKVDATHSSVEIGDLLTTSSVKGHAMKADDPYKAFGSVIGKAIGSLKEGLGMIPVLVALQ